MDAVDAVVRARPAWGEMSSADIDLAGAQQRERLSGSAGSSVSSTAGWRSRKRAIASGMIVAPALGNAASRSRPPRRPAIASSSASASASRARIDVGVIDERAPGVGQPHAAAAALDELRAGLALERRDLLGDGRLRVRQALGGGGERALRGDLAQDAHTADIEH